MSFHALDVAIQICRELRKPLARIATKDRDLARQIRRAASGVPLHVAEGRERAGADQRHLYRVARGSCNETGTGLDVAVAYDYIDEASLVTVRELIDRERAMLWRMIG